MIVKKRKVDYGLPTLSILLSAGLFLAWPLAAITDHRTGFTDYGNRLPYELNTAALALSSQDVLAGMEIMEEASLAQLRGGFTLAGMDMNFGATLRTRIDDIRMETVMKLSRIEEEISVRTHSNIASAIETTKAQTASAAGNGKRSGQGRQITLVGPSSGRSLTEDAPRSFELAALQEIPGVVVQDTQGFMAILHDMTRNSILSTVIGNASARDIHQELDIRVDIGNIKSLKAAQLRSRIADSLRF